MDIREQELFKDVFNHFQEKYPNSRIERVKQFDREVIRVNGEDRFCITGYNLVYNLYRLTKCLEGELI